MTDNVRDVIEGVQDALVETGETGTVKRTTTVRDPLNPSKVTTVTKTYSMRMYVNEPRSVYVADGVTVNRKAQLFVDWLSVVDTDTQQLVNDKATVLANVASNTWPVWAFETKQGDVVTRANGEVLTLLENTGTNINGVTVMGLHELER